MMILLTGGSACGKSSLAESICLGLPLPRYYIATMQPYGESGRKRVSRHRKMREGKGFQTVERYFDLASLVLPQRGTALLECIGNLVANEMFGDIGTGGEPATGQAGDPASLVMCISSGIAQLAGQCDNIVVVTNEVGSDGAFYDEGTREYIEVLGRVNAALAEQADVVCETVCGIPIPLKGSLDLSGVRESPVARWSSGFQGPSGALEPAGPVGSSSTPEPPGFPAVEGAHEG